jgi:hypothetical protein
MDQLARAAFIISQAACANAEVAAMQAANQRQISEGKALLHGPEDFRNVERIYHIGHNAVLEYLR